MAGWKDPRERLRQAHKGIEDAERERVAAARAAKDAKVPVQEIAELLGYKQRRSVYVLLKIQARGETSNGRYD